MAIKPDLTKFVAINFNNGVVNINGIERDSIVNLKQLDFHYQDIRVMGDSSNPRVVTKRSNKNIFFDIAASDTHIYAIYSGKSFKEAGLIPRSLRLSVGLRLGWQFRRLLSSECSSICHQSQQSGRSAFWNPY
jgi:hypothetical protein